MLTLVKCQNCGGRLEGAMKFCPYCGVRPDIDLRQVNFRDLGHNAAMPCPCCKSALDVIEFDFQPPVTIERCTTCHGLFFNPGELELILEAQVNPVIWLDLQQLGEFDAIHAQNLPPRYRKCPSCDERMSQTVFGGRSGVIIDRCGTHGLWLDGGDLHRITEWWRAGGKLIYQQNEQDKTKRLFHKPQVHTSTFDFPISPNENPVPSWGTPPSIDHDATLFGALRWFVSCIMK